MTNDLMISVDNVSKKFCKNYNTSLKYGLFDITNKLLKKDTGNILRNNEFWSVKDVSFQLNRGECLGLIGKNGSGKSTLLKIINNIIEPTRGSVKSYGKIGAIISLGAGFNPILSGRENIYINGAILGMSRSEIKAKISEIIEFAELEDFIDSPVQSYSSGMYMRLGFSIAASLRPDILILDEVLAVGDISFRYKCYKKIDSLKENTAIIFVSHDMPNILRLCSKSIVMMSGSPYYFDNVSDGVKLYNSINSDKFENDDKKTEYFFGINHFKSTVLKESIHQNEQLPINLSINSQYNFESFNLTINILNQGGAYVASAVINSDDFSISLKNGDNFWRITLSSVPLKEGDYYLSYGLADINGKLLTVAYKSNKISIYGGSIAGVSDCLLHINKWEKS
jgi:lipopolysaccharide transport system ATP-binding protein